MNTRYLELQDKLLVIDEKGNVINRENKENIEEILILENRLEKTNNLIKEHENEIKSINNDIKYTKKNSKILILLGYFIYAVYVVVSLATFGKNISLIDIQRMIMIGTATIGIATLYNFGTKLECKKILREHIPRLERIITTLKNEKTYLNKKLNELKKIDKKPQKVTSINHNFVKLYDYEFDEYLNETLYQVDNAKPKKKVRKLF